MNGARVRRATADVGLVIASVDEPGARWQEAFEVLMGRIPRRLSAYDLAGRYAALS